MAPAFPPAPPAPPVGVRLTIDRDGAPVFNRKTTRLLVCAFVLVRIRTSRPWLNPTANAPVVSKNPRRSAARRPFGRSPFDETLRISSDNILSLEGRGNPLLDHGSPEIDLRLRGRHIIFSIHEIGG